MEISDEAVIVKSSRLKSVVWNDFDRVKNGDSYVAVCRHCKKKLCGSSTSGTSHLRNHLIRCRRRSNHDITQLISAKGKKKEGSLALANFTFDQEHKRSKLVNIAHRYEQGQTKDSSVNVGHGNFDSKRSRFDLARMIILHGYPLSMVDHVGFQVFVRNLQPMFELMPFNRVETDCIEIYKKEKQKVSEVLDKLPGKINLSADKWATKDGGSYFSLTAHFIDDDWLLKRKLLNFIVIDPSHTEEMLSEVIMTSLMEWDIDRKLFSVTFDSSSTNENIVCRIRDRLCQNRFLLCDGQLFDVCCAANIIKLMAKDALDALLEVTHKIRESIRYVKSSQATQEKFNEMVQLVGVVEGQRCLCLDNPLQWNSTYFMIEVALEYKDAFSLLQEHEPLYTMCPSEVEWSRASAIASYLKLFVEVLNPFTRTKNPTANIYFHEICEVHLQLIEWCQNSDAYVSSLALKMKSKFDEYWKKCSLALAISAILDPRFKMKLVEYYYPQIYGTSAPDCIDIVSNCMKALYNGHAIGSPLDSHGQGLACQVGSNLGVGNESRDRLTGFDRFLHETSQSQNMKSDLDKYLEEPLFPRNMDFNILNWWKVHTPRYPILSMMARNILGIPMSKVSLESAFRVGDRMLDHYWSSLKSDTVQGLMCAQDWMRNEPEDFKSTSSHSPLSICYDVN
ncbi:hypothetical protein NMG60_11031174 [Bertholletia excelsa]